MLRTLAALLRETKEREAANEPFVSQKYIERPLLVRGRKFDIRQWVLLAAIRPVRAFWYEQSYLRFCSTQFTLDNLDDRYVMRLWW